MGGAGAEGGHGPPRAPAGPPGAAPPHRESAGAVAGEPPLGIVAGFTPDLEYEGDKAGLLFDPLDGDAPAVLSPELADSWREEVKRIAKLALPLISQNVLTYVSGILAVAFIGHLGSQQLSAAVLGNSIFNVSGLSLMIGLSQALETLCGQAYGARQYSMVGVYLQRSLVICGLASLPLIAGFTQAPRILRLMGQDPEISALAGQYLLGLAPALVGSGLTECLRRFLVAQGQVHVPNAAAVLSTALTPLFLWLLVFRAGLGLIGGALATAAGQWVNALVHLAFIAFIDGPHKRCWPGFSLEAFRGWGMYMSIALPAIAMLCFEWWTFEILIIMSGLLPNPDVAISAVGIAFQVDVMVFMPGLGFSAALSTRVTNELGARRPRMARRAAAISTAMMIASAACLVSCMLALHIRIPRLFTLDPEVVSVTSRMLLVVAATCFGDAWQSALSGLLRAVRRAGLGAVSSFICYYCVGIPLAYLAAFHTSLGPTGVWVGLAVASNLAIPAYLIIFSVIDWDREALRSIELVRAGSVSVLRKPGATEDVSGTEVTRSDGSGTGTVWSELARRSGQWESGSDRRAASPETPGFASGQGRTSDVEAGPLLGSQHTRGGAGDGRAARGFPAGPGRASSDRRGVPHRKPPRAPSPG